MAGIPERTDREAATPELLPPLELTQLRELDYDDRGDGSRIRAIVAR